MKSLKKIFIKKIKILKMFIIILLGSSLIITPVAILKSKNNNIQFEIKTNKINTYNSNQDFLLKNENNLINKFSTNKKITDPIEAPLEVEEIFNDFFNTKYFTFDPQTKQIKSAKNQEFYDFDNLKKLIRLDNSETWELSKESDIFPEFIFNNLILNEKMKNELPQKSLFEFALNSLSLLKKLFIEDVSESIRLAEEEFNQISFDETDQFEILDTKIKEYLNEIGDFLYMLYSRIYYLIPGSAKLKIGTDATFGQFSVEKLLKEIIIATRSFFISFWKNDQNNMGLKENLSGFIKAFINSDRLLKLRRELSFQTYGDLKKISKVTNENGELKFISETTKQLNNKEEFENEFEIQYPAIWNSIKIYGNFKEQDILFKIDKSNSIYFQIEGKKKITLKNFSLQSEIQEYDLNLILEKVKAKYNNIQAEYYWNPWGKNYIWFSDSEGHEIKELRLYTSSYENPEEKKKFFDNIQNFLNSTNYKNIFEIPSFESAWKKFINANFDEKGTDENFIQLKNSLLESESQIEEGINIEVSSENIPVQENEKNLQIKSEEQETNDNFIFLLTKCVDVFETKLVSYVIDSIVKKEIKKLDIFSILKKQIKSPSKNDLFLIGNAINKLNYIIEYLSENENLENEHQVFELKDLEVLTKINWTEIKNLFIEEKNLEIFKENETLITLLNKINKIKTNLFEYIKKINFINNEQIKHLKVFYEFFENDFDKYFNNYLTQEVRTSEFKHIEWEIKDLKLKSYVIYPEAEDKKLLVLKFINKKILSENIFIFDKNKKIVFFGKNLSETEINNKIRSIDTDE